MTSYVFPWPVCAFFETCCCRPCPELHLENPINVIANSAPLSNINQSKMHQIGLFLRPSLSANLHKFGKYSARFTHQKPLSSFKHDFKRQYREIVFAYSILSTYIDKDLKYFWFLSKFAEIIPVSILCLLT